SLANEKLPAAMQHQAHRIIVARRHQGRPPSAAEAMDKGPAHRWAAIPGLSCAAALLSTVDYPSEILPYDDRLHLRVAARCAASPCDMASHPDCASRSCLP